MAMSDVEEPAASAWVVLSSTFASSANARDIAELTIWRSFGFLMRASLSLLMISVFLVLLDVDVHEDEG